MTQSHFRLSIFSFLLTTYIIEIIRGDNSFVDYVLVFLSLLLIGIELKELIRSNQK